MGKDWAAAPLGDGDAAGVGAAPPVEPLPQVQQLLSPATAAAAEGVKQPLQESVP